jgi:NADPH-dependent 2,4-dienoyl-CoA reductase/sulfur reductase-like enzyme
MGSERRPSQPGCLRILDSRLEADRLTATGHDEVATVGRKPRAVDNRNAESHVAASGGIRATRNGTTHWSGMMNSHPRFAVIGAGIAGLSCATVLQQAGLRVSLFDKSNGPAGRMSTRRGDGWQCDHGAQYFTARDPEFRAEVTRWVEAGVAGLWKPRLKVFDGASAQDRDSTLERC